MAICSRVCSLFAVVLLFITRVQFLQARVSNEKGVKSSTFLSPKFYLGPGAVVNKFYNNIDFPRGHIAIKGFDAEVVDENGNPVPLQETYLHHWLVVRYYQRKGVENSKNNVKTGFEQSDLITVGNSGVCIDTLYQYFGLGSETRKTETHVPHPYGIEVGNPNEVPDGYMERWSLNVHAIDTRGVEDPFGCTECRCDLYNATKDNDRPLPPDYVGGLRCCHDMMQCRLMKGFESFKKGLYMKYTVKWVDWDSSILPVKIYIFDVTDKWKRLDESTGRGTSHACQVEYDIEPCDNNMTTAGCISTKRLSFSIPNGGNVIYGVAHQHRGGIGSTLYGEDGRVICTSIPFYGKGSEPGNETGYIVGMSTCYPQPGSVKIFDGENLIMESNYSSSESHTGVMGLFYVLLADPLPGTNSLRHASFDVQEEDEIPASMWALSLVGVAIVAAAIVAYRRLQNQEVNGYHSVLM